MTRIDPSRIDFSRTDKTGRGAAGRDPGSSLTISCDECIMQGTSACADCVVTFLCDREPGEAVVIDVEELRSLRVLSEAGLVPGLRHRRRA